MFDFEKLDVYRVVKDLNTKTYTFLSEINNIDEHVINEWKKASLAVVKNLAEGVGRTSNEDKRNFIIVSRANVFICVAILQSLQGLKLIEEGVYQEFYNDYETASKMLLGMFRSFK